MKTEEANELTNKEDQYLKAATEQPRTQRIYLVHSSHSKHNLKSKNKRAQV